jgi:hypothetical protein
VKKDDILQKINSQDVPDLQSAVRWFRGSKPGSAVTLTVKRADKEVEVKVKVGILPFSLLNSDLNPTPRIGCLDPELREELLKRMKADQDIRQEWQRLDPPNTYPKPLNQLTPEIKAVLEKMDKIDKDNLVWLRGVVDKKGWPGRTLVGRDGAKGAFLIAQHAVNDLDFMSKCLGLLEPAYKAGEVEGQWIALMTDRLLVMRDKKKQRYGTQLMAKDGKLIPQPIEDEAHVDQRRKEFGMPPLAEYLRRVNEPPPASVRPKQGQGR